VKVPRCMLNHPLALAENEILTSSQPTAWENQRPKQRATSGHAARLESWPGPLVRTSYRNTGRCLQFDAWCWSQQQPSMHIVPFITPTVFYTNQNIPIGRNQFSLRGRVIGLAAMVRCRPRKDSSSCIQFAQPRAFKNPGMG
jgi:hypothetical protein